MLAMAWETASRQEWLKVMANVPAIYDKTWEEMCEWAREEER